LGCRVRRGKQNAGAVALGDNMRRHPLCFAVVLAAAIAFCCGAAQAQTKTIVKYAISDAEGPLPAAQALKTFKAYVEYASDGRIEVQTFFGTMGAARETTEQAKLGTLQMTNAEDGAFGGFYPKIQAINLPYLFPAGAVAWDFLNGEFARKMGDDIRKTTGLRVLAFTENGVRHFGTNDRQEKTPDDASAI